MFNIPSFFGFRAGGSVPLLLNEFPGAAAAYSLRLLDSTYLGDAIQVRESTNNTTLDIGFVNGELDTASLLAHCAGANGFVTEWYDQSGNANNATQTTALNQPQIVSSGSVILDNGKPAIFWNKDNLNNLRNLVLSTSASMTYSWVGSMTLPITSFSYVFQIGTFSANTGYMLTPFMRAGNNDFLAGDLANFGRGFSTGSAPRFVSNGIQVLNNIQVLFNGILTSTIAKAYKNNSAISSRVSIAASVPITSGLTIGNNTFNEAYPGKMQELIFWGADQDSNISGINTNINNFYTIF